MIKQSVEVIRAAAEEQRGFASQVIDPPKLKARFLEAAADLDRAADRLAALERWQLDLHQDRCEGALVEASLLDEARRVIAGFDSEHPFLTKPIASYGVWASQRKEIDRLNRQIRQLEKAAQCGPIMDY